MSLTLSDRLGLPALPYQDAMCIKKLLTTDDKLLIESCCQSRALSQLSLQASRMWIAKSHPRLTAQIFAKMPLMCAIHYSVRSAMAMNVKMQTVINRMQQFNLPLFGNSRKSVSFFALRRDMYY